MKLEWSPMGVAGQCFWNTHHMLRTGVPCQARGIRMHIPEQKWAHRGNCPINRVGVQALTRLAIWASRSSQNSLPARKQCCVNALLLRVPTALTLVMWVVVVVLVVSDVIVCALISTPGSISAPASTYRSKGTDTTLRHLYQGVPMIQASPTITVLFKQCMGAVALGTHSTELGHS